MADNAPYLNASLKATKVEYRQLGQSGLRVSMPIFGAMSLGDKRSMPWAVEEEEVWSFIPRVVSGQFLLSLPTFPFKDTHPGLR